MLVPRAVMNKHKFLRIAIPFCIAFSVLAGVVYWQRTNGLGNLPIGAAQPTSLLEYEAEGKSPREIAK